MRNLRLPALLAGTATTALLLSACGSGGATTSAPASLAPVSSTAAPALETPSESPSPSPSSSAPASRSSSAPAQEVVDDDDAVDDDFDYRLR